MRLIKPALQQSQGRSLPWSGATLINAFAERAEGDKAADFAVMAIPGLDVFATAGDGPIRGAIQGGIYLYVLSGTTLYAVIENGTVSEPLGTIDGTLPVRMAYNGSQVAIVGGTFNNTGYVYDAGVLYTGIANLPVVSDVAFIDGYFAWTVWNSDQFIISALNDGLTYDPLDVASVEGSPDNLVAVVNDHRELQFYGTRTVEIWYNNGDADFPFARQGNAFIERGCVDRDSTVKIDNSVTFVGDDLIVYRLDGYTPIRISTHAIEFHIASAAWYRAYSLTIEGHKFYVLNTDTGTYAYDSATGLWAERTSTGYDNYRVGTAAQFYNNYCLCDSVNGNIYLQNFDTYTEDGVAIPIEIGLPTLMADRERVTLYALEVYCETGVGNGAAPDPTMYMQYSKDSGRTYSTAIGRTLGAAAEYLTRAIWRPHVQFRQMQIKLTVTDPVRRLVMSYFADIR